MSDQLSLTHEPTIFSLPITLYPIIVVARNCKKLYGPRLFHITNRDTTSP